MLFDLNTRGRAFASAAFNCRLPLLLAVMAVLVWLPSPSVAVEMESLYTVEVPLDPDDRNARSNAYRSALTEVLVRITGTTAAGESPELIGLFPNPTQDVRQVRSAPDNVLVVSLDGPAVERVLRQAGATVWGSDRPLTIIWLAVDWGLGDREIVGADDPERFASDARSIDRNRLLRERVQAVATRRGLPVVFPLLDVEDLQKIGFIDIWGGFDDPLLEASARYEAESILVGRIRPEQLEEPRWTWYIDGQRFAWPGEPEVAIEQVVDALVARDAVRGDEVSESLRLTVTGINSLASYGRVQRYLESNSSIESLAIVSASADRVVYEATVRGGAERLQSTLAMSRVLAPAERGIGIDGGSFPSYGDPLEQDSLEFVLVPEPRRPEFLPEPEQGN